MAVFAVVQYGKSNIRLADVGKSLRGNFKSRMIPACVEVRRPLYVTELYLISRGIGMNCSIGYGF